MGRLYSPSADQLLNKSFRIKSNTSSNEKCPDQDNPDLNLSFNESLNMLNDLREHLLTIDSTKKTPPVTEVLEGGYLHLDHESKVNSKSNPSNECYNDKAKLDKGIQVNIDNLIDSSVYYKKCLYLEKRISVLIRDISLLHEKIRSDKKAFEESLDLIRSESEKYQQNNVDLAAKLQTLEEILRFKQNLKHNPINTMKSHTKNSTCKVGLVADSHGKGLSQLLTSKSSHKVFSFIKPGARSSEVLNTDVSDCNVRIILAGANDVYCNESKIFLRKLKEVLAVSPWLKTIICTIPLRYDLPSWSIVNKEIRRVNSEITTLIKHFKNVFTIDLEGIGRRFHTQHGQHLNFLGKTYLNDRIMDILSTCVLNSKDKTKNLVALPWKIQRTQ
jgi:hypothetical protein